MHRHVLSKGSKSPNNHPRDLVRRDSMSDFVRRNDPKHIMKKKTVGHVEQGIAAMQADTKFGDLELKHIYEKYHRETVTSPGRMNLDQFSNMMRDVVSDLDDRVIVRYYQQFDSDENGSVDFREFVSGLGVLLKGSVEEKLKFIFKSYDLDGNGFIDREEMKHWLKSTFVTGVNLLQELLHSMNIHVTHFDESKQDSDLMDQIVTDCFAASDKQGTGMINESDFLAWCQQQPTIMKLLATEHAE